MRGKIAAAAACVRAVRAAGATMPRPVRALVYSGVLLAVMIAAVAVVLLGHLRERTLIDAARELDGLSLVLAEDADRAMQAVDLLQDRVLDRLRDRGVNAAADLPVQMSSQSIHDMLVTSVAALPQVSLLALLDAGGRPVNSSRESLPGDDYSDREYFRALSTGAGRDRFVSGPLKSRVDGAWTMFVARRLAASDGGFLGLVLVGIRLSFFENLYHAAALRPDYALSLFGDGDVLLARYPPREPAIGHVFRAVAAHGVRAADGTPRVWRLVSQIDGAERMLAPRHLPHFPLVMNVSRTVAAVLAPWEEQVRLLGGGALCLDIGLIGLVAMGVRQLGSQERLRQSEAARAAAEERAHGERGLRNQYARFGTALDNMAQGLGMFDESNRLVVANRRLGAMLGVIEPPAPATSLAGCLDRVSGAGLLRADEVRAAAIALRRMLASRAPASTMWELADGRALSAGFQPTDEGGWLLTLDDVTEQRQAAARIGFLAHHDALTWLPNRILFHERLAQSVRLAERGIGCAVLCLDLDRFKEVNDTMGHPAGDVLLREVAVRLQRCVREGDTVARLGGDEFAVIQTELHQAEDGTALASRILDAISAPYNLLGEQVVVGVSIGIAVAPDDGMTAETLLKHADIALYRAKEDGRGCFRFFESHMNTRLEARRALDVGLRRALIAGEFEMFYQPLLRLSDRRLTGFEALMRWRHEARGLISPAEFIPVAEETGQIVAMGELALQLACAEAAGWPDDIKIAVNLSPVQFKSDSLVEAVASVLRRSGLRPQRLELEITETVLLRDTADTLATLRRLHDLGVAIVLDDFGTGYSSLSYMSRFSFDKVKIDRSFVQDLGRRSEAEAIVRAIINLCAHLNVVSLAEGVETEEQATALARENCGQVQGFLFSPPVPAGEVAALLARFGAEICEAAV